MPPVAHATDGRAPCAPEGDPPAPALTGRDRLIRLSIRGFILLDCLLLAGFVVAVGGYFGPLDGSPHFPLVTNAIGLYVLLLCAAGLALADTRRFRPMLLFISGTYAVQVACLVFMAARHGLSGEVSILQLFDLPESTLFVVWLSFASVVAVLFGVLYRLAPTAKLPLPGERDVGWQQVLLRVVLGAASVVFVAFIVLYLARGIEGEADLAFTAASVSKDALFLAFALLALIKPARWASLTLVVVAGHFALVVSNGLLLLSGSIAGPAPAFGGDPPLGGDGVDVARTWLLADLAVNAVLIAVLWIYQRARYRLDYLWPPAVRALEAFADALFELVPDRVPPRTVAENVDAYLAAFKGRARMGIQGLLVALYYLPIGWRLAPFTALSRENRLAWAQKRFDRVDMAAIWPIGDARRGIRALIRGAQQFAYVGYYSQREGWETTGFEPYSERRGAAQAIATVNRNRPGVEVTEPWQIGGRELEADVIVIGSGAAGAILAYRLAEAGKNVVVLERGAHVRPSQMTEDEMDMFAKLYSDGALQISRDFGFQVAQGRCVGGSTTVNNAVCLQPSQVTMEDWRCRVRGLELSELDSAFKRVEGFLNVRTQPDTVRTVAARELERGLLSIRRPVERVHANIEECLGCGYCNSGCAYGKKLSMLDSVLVWGQQRFGKRLRIVAECEVRRIVESHGRAHAVECRLSDGRPLRVAASDRVIVSAGAIASSRLLQRSRTGGPRVGEGLTFNLRTAVAARFPHEVRSWAGLQMTDAYRPDESTPWMIESWSVPVVSQALAMPGWFGLHEKNMKDLRHIGWAGILVGAKTKGRVIRRPTGSEFEFEPNDEDLAQLRDAFEVAGEALFHANAERVMVSTHRPLVVSRNGNSPAEAARRLRECLDEVIEGSSDMLNMGSSHPQGGNAMSTGPETGVVDADCRVHGYRNLYVCDASVFPTSVTVNPQLTVMALAEYAARRMLRPPADRSASSK